jgi:hypothetical protein
MEKMIGFCGIVCSDCPALLATKKDDESERKRVAKLFTKEYGIEFEPEDINCEDCPSGSQCVFAYCALCEIRKCGRGSKIKNCADCIEYPCGKLFAFFNKYLKAKQTLDEIRGDHGSAKQA